MVSRTLTLGGREIPYELTRKPVKRVNIRVYADGRVAVSAGQRVPVEEIERILRRKANFLLRALDRFAAQAGQRPKAHTYGPGETVYLLGRPYTMVLQAGRRKAIQVEGDRILLTLPDPEDPQRRVKAMEDFFRETCLAVTTRLCQQIQPALAALGVPIPEIRVRSMTSRWGSCTPSARRVTFARQLVEAPEDCVIYVVCHELVHFVHPDHSKGFYACLASVLPDWKARQQVLNSYSYRQNTSP